MQLDIGRNPKELFPEYSKEYFLPTPLTNAQIVARTCSAQQPQMESRAAGYFGARLATMLRRREILL